jgi:hypothetical protein
MKDWFAMVTLIVATLIVPLMAVVAIMALKFSFIFGLIYLVWSLIEPVVMKLIG